jgi:hypothetical protein
MQPGGVAAVRHQEQIEILVGLDQGVDHLRGGSEVDIFRPARR